MIGERFSRLMVVAYAGVKDQRRQWKCLCDCGNETVVAAKKLKSGHTKSCGCYAREKWSKHCLSMRTHRMTKTRTYKSWQSMKERCLNPNSIRYPIYGAKGITVCDLWRDSFEQFLADMGERPAGKTLDRKDNAKGYEPSNCRWATYAEQTANRSRKSGWKIPHRRSRLTSSPS